MQTHVRERLEGEIRALVADGRETEATTRAIQTFGPEILGFLVGIARTEADATDAFSIFCEHLWKGLPAFRWECALRTWCYVLARRAAARTVRGRRPVEPLSTGGLERIVDTIATATLPFVRAQQREKVIALRAALDPEDRILLTLRVDKELEWRDVARVMADAESGGGDTDDDLERRAAALRKRFERVKQTLRASAEADGLS